MRKRILYIVLAILTALGLTSCSESKEELIAKIEDRETEADIQEPASLFDDTLPISVTYQDEEMSLEKVDVFKNPSSDNKGYNYYIYIEFEIGGMSVDLFDDLVNQDTSLEFDVSIMNICSDDTTINGSDIYSIGADFSDDAKTLRFYLATSETVSDSLNSCNIELCMNFPNTPINFYSVSAIDIQNISAMPGDIIENFNNYINEYPYGIEPIATETENFTPSPTSTPTPEPTPTIQSYGGGTLKVGTDIPAGEYIILATDSDGGYFSVNSDANGDDIIFNENFGYNSIITVYDGEYLELSRSRAYPFNEWCAQNTINITQEEATFKVGVNLPAGEYLLVATSEDGGYYCIYPDSRQQDIVANDNFEDQTYVNVSDGQYLTLSRCAISQ